MKVVTGVLVAPIALFVSIPISDFMSAIVGTSFAHINGRSCVETLYLVACQPTGRVGVARKNAEGETFRGRFFDEGGHIRAVLFAHQDGDALASQPHRMPVLQHFENVGDGARLLGESGAAQVPQRVGAVSY